jgi:hypothetical protein
MLDDLMLVDLMIGDLISRFATPRRVLDVEWFVTLNSKQ